MRLLFRTAIAAVLAVVAAAAATPAQAAAPVANWTHAGYGPGNTGYNPAESVVNAGTIKRLKLRWSLTPGPGDPGCGPGGTTPLVVGGRAFMYDDGGVAAFDVRTGRRLWLNTGFSLLRAHLIAVGDLIVATDTNCYSNSSYDGHITAMDARTGVTRWRSSQSWTIDTMIADAGVIVASGYCHTCDDFEHGTTAFRVTDGVRLWGQENTRLAGPVSAGGRIMLTRTLSRQSAVVNIRTGQLIWGWGAQWSARAADPSGNRFYLRNTAGLSAVDARTAKTYWRIRGEAGDLATDGRRVFVASANRVNAYHATTGRLAWTRVLATPSRPIRAGGLLYVRSRTSLMILSPTTGRVVASGARYGKLSGHVVAAGGRLYTLAGTTVRAYAP